jgi:hypothetical protein
MHVFSVTKQILKFLEKLMFSFMLFPPNYQHIKKDMIISQMNWPNQFK